MPVDFSGTWVISGHDDFGPLCDKLQLPEDKRPPSKLDNVEVVFEQDGDKIRIVNKTPLGTTENSFTVGESFKLVMLGNMPEVDVSSAWDGDRLVFTDARGIKLVRELVDGQTVSMFVAGDVSCKLYFKKK